MTLKHYGPVIGLRTTLFITQRLNDLWLIQLINCLIVRYNPSTWHEAIDEIYKLKGIMITEQEHLDKTQTGRQIDREMLRLLRVINGMFALGVITWAVWGINTVVSWFI